MSQTYDVDGVALPRPFKIRRFGHLGLNLRRLDEAREFYCGALGFRLSEERDLFAELPAKMAAKAREVMTDPRMFFATYGADHHSLLLADHSFGTYFGHDRQNADNTLSQVTWQVGSLREVVEASNWLIEQGVRLVRVGRDMPGSNWHVYFLDPDGTTIELYYGMEQIGWDRRSKPEPMHDRAFFKAPPLPQIAEIDEVYAARQAGVDMTTGYAPDERAGDRCFDVGGVLLERPFKIVGLGPLSVFTDRLDEMVDFYTRIVGLVHVESAMIDGKRIEYLRYGTGHHTLVLVDKSLRVDLGLSEHSSTMAIGLQLGGYRQLRDAAQYLTSRGYRLVDSIPPEAHLGIDYAVHVADPDGHLVQLYYYMETVGWDGRPRPHDQRATVLNGSWPEQVAEQSDTYCGHPFQGPLG